MKKCRELEAKVEQATDPVSLLDSIKRMQGSISEIKLENIKDNNSLLDLAMNENEFDTKFISFLEQINELL